MSDCLFIRVREGETKVCTQHDLSTEYWTSPDIYVHTDATETVLDTTAMYQVQQDTTYFVDVAVSNGGSTLTLTQANPLTVEVYDSPPTLSFDPALTEKLGVRHKPSTAVQDSLAGGKSTKLPADNRIPWTPKTTGHRCLLARCFLGKTAPAGEPNPADPHVATHNTFIDKVAPAPAPHYHFAIATSASSPAVARVEPVADARRLDRLARMLEGDRHFKRFAPAPPPVFGLVHAGTGPVAALARPEAPQHRLAITPARGPQWLALTADLGNSRPGDAHVFDVRQDGADGRPYGGVTVIAVRT